MEHAPSAQPAIDTDPHVEPAAYVTADTPGVGGRIKVRPEDFLVEEIPLYEPCGEGEHLYLFIEKRGLSMTELIAALAEHFGVRRDAIGFAGLKDKRAITRQVVSVHVPGHRVEDFPMIRRDGLAVLWADMHTNKLRRGHLVGNRFSIRVRDVTPTAVVAAKRVLDRLARTGVPNRIGEQRFGYLRNNHLIGRAMILGEHRAALDLLLGPNELAGPGQHRARVWYAQGRFREAWRAFPRHLRTERAALRALADGAGPERALAAVESTIRGFYISAFQSAVFNAVLDRRVLDGTLGVLLSGDVAFLHANRATFPVTDETLAQPDLVERTERFEISPTGPMWGASMRRASGAVGEAEAAALAAVGLTPERLTARPELRTENLGGTRRPLRVRLKDPEVEGGVDEFGPFVRCAFELPRGSFATTVMGEVMKPPLGADAGEAAGVTDPGEP